MALPIPPNDPNLPIPNDPFFYPRTNYVQGPLGPLIIGTGLDVTVDGQLIATGGGGGSGTVTQIDTGAGLDGGPITTTGVISLEPSGVTAGNYVLPALTVDTYGRITAINSGTPGVISVGGASPLSSSGGINPVISLNNSGVTQGTYTLSTITVNAQGLVTSASNGSVNVGVTNVTATSPIQSTGGATPNISLANSTVTPNTYTYPTITVDQKGLITFAVNGVAPVTSVAGAAPLTSSGGTTPTISLNPSGVTTGNYTYATVQLDTYGRVTSASSGTPPVTAVTATAPVVSSGGLTPAISLANSGVTAGNYTNPNITVDALGRITLASSGSPAVQTVTATSPLTSSGGINPQISLDLSGVTNGSYTNASITVDGFGRVTAASSGVAPVTSVTANAPLTQSGTAAAPVLGVQVASTGQLGAVQVGTNIDVDAGGIISVASSSTTQAGIVQLNDTVASTSITEALTANQGKNLQDQINSLTAASNLTLAGTFDAANSQMVTVTVDGAAQSFAIGSNLPAAAAGNTDYFVIVTTGGSYNPPGGGGPYTTSQGDWFVSTGAAWSYLNVGFDLPVASTSTAGVVQLATSAETQSGTNSTKAVTPAGAASAYVPLAALTGKGALISANAANSFETISVGTNGQLLTADSTTASGLKWVTLALDYIPENTFTAAGQLITGTGAGTYVALSPGTNGKFLVTNSACTGGLEWVTPNYLQPSLFTGKGTLLTASAASTPFALTVGGDGQVLTACSTATGGLCWAPVSTPSIPCACITGKGALVTGTGASTPVALPVGTDGQVLTACSAATSGLCWAAASVAAIPCGCLTAKGDIITTATPSTPVALPVGTDGQVLTADSTCTTGLKWATIGSATSTVRGLILGCTTTAATFLGCNSGGSSGASVFANVAIGTNALCQVSSPNNTAIGYSAMSQVTGIAQSNTGVGSNVLRCLTTGSYNIALGQDAGGTITTGSFNVAIGIYAQPENPAGDLQLHIGCYFCYWLRGDCNYNIRPGAGLRDCAGCLGTAGQVLSSTGTALQWTNGGFGDTPVGAINWFASSTAPSGWLVADGSVVSRTTYAALFAAIGTTYGAGDGSTTFKLPDLRGMFLRGWDSAGGTARGCDPGRAFGSSQGSALGSHCHEVAVIAGSAGRPEWTIPNNACPLSASFPCACLVGAPVRSGGFTTTDGSAETRPVNVALLPCIKWQVTTAPSSCGIPCACITAKGSLVTGNAANTPIALPVGTDGQALVACAACSTGLTWAVPAGRCAVGICNSMSYLALDDFDYTLWNSCRSFVIRNRSASNKVVGWTTIAMNASNASCAFCGVSQITIPPNADRYLFDQLTLTTFNASQTALISVYANAAPSAGPALCVYCFTGIIGDGYANNFMCIQRLY